MEDVTLLLQSIRAGEDNAGSRLMAVVYAELRRIAAAKLAREKPGHTLQTADLVHEAWLRMVDTQGQLHFQNRAHFFGAAAEAMRRILIDAARRKKATRHGGEMERVEGQHLEIAVPAADEELLAVHEALDHLAEHDRRKAELVKLRYFAGLTLDQAADVLGISIATAKRDWTYSRAWLFREIDE